MNENARPQQVAADFWHEFERRLAVLPGTAHDASARQDLVATARSHQADAAIDVSATEYADLAHRMRFRLGPSVSSATLDEVAQHQMSAAADLLAAGVEPEVLGLVEGSGSVG